MKAWLKGGLIGVSLLVVTFILMGIVNLIKYPYGWMIGEALEEVYLVNALMPTVYIFIKGIFLMIIKWFLVGALIGLIIQKLKR